jgi:hypothetical protein
VLVQLRSPAECQGARCWSARWSREGAGSLFHRVASSPPNQWDPLGAPWTPNVKYRGDLQSSTGRRISASLLALAALAFGANSLQSFAARADARTAVGTKLDIIMRSGEQRAEHPFGWKGISADWVNVDRRDLPRFDVRVVCSERCPSDLLQTEVGQDTVVWKTGPNTKGYVEVSCEERCVVRQNGQSRPWDDVRYVQLRPSLGGCFARSDDDKARPLRVGL